MKYFTDNIQPEARYPLKSKNFPRVRDALILLRKNLIARPDVAEIVKDKKYHATKKAQELLLLVKQGGPALLIAEKLCDIRDRCGYFFLTGEWIEDIAVFHSDPYCCLFDLSWATEFLERHNRLPGAYNIPYKALLEDRSGLQPHRFVEKAQELKKIYFATCLLQDELERRADAALIKSDRRYDGILAAQKRLLLAATDIAAKDIASDCARFICDIRGRCGYFFLTKEFLGEISIFYRNSCRVLEDLSQATKVLEAHNRLPGAYTIPYTALLEDRSGLQPDCFVEKAQELKNIYFATCLLQDELERRADAALLKTDLRYDDILAAQKRLLLAAKDIASDCARLICDIRGRCGYFFLTDKLINAITSFNRNPCDALLDLNQATILIENYNNSVSADGKIPYEKLLEDWKFNVFHQQNTEQSELLISFYHAQSILQKHLETKPNVATIKRILRDYEIEEEQKKLLLKAGKKASDCAQLICDIRDRCGYFSLRETLIKHIASCKPDPLQALLDLNQATILIQNYNDLVSSDGEIPYDLLLEDREVIAGSVSFKDKAEILISFHGSQYILQDDLERKNDRETIKQDERYHNILNNQKKLLLKAGEKASKCARLICDIRGRCGYFFLTENLIKEITSLEPNPFDALIDLNQATILIENYNDSTESTSIPYDELMRYEGLLATLREYGSGLSTQIEKLICIYPALSILRTDLENRHDCRAIKEDERYTRKIEDIQNYLLYALRSDSVTGAQLICELRQRCGYFYLSNDVLSHIGSTHDPLKHLMELNDATSKIERYNKQLEGEQQPICFEALLEKLSTEALDDHDQARYFTEKAEVLFTVHQAQTLLSDALNNESNLESIKHDERYSKIEEAQHALLSVLGSNAIIGAQLICEIRQRCGYFYLSDNMLQEIKNTQSPFNHLRGLRNAIVLIEEYHQENSRQSELINTHELLQNVTTHSLNKYSSGRYFISIAETLIIRHKAQIMLRFQLVEGRETAAAIAHTDYSFIEEAQNNLLQKAGMKAIEWAQEICSIRNRCGDYFLSQNFFQQLMHYDNKNVFDLLSELNLATAQLQAYNQSVEEELQHSYEELLTQDATNSFKRGMFTERFNLLMSRRLPSFDVPMPAMNQHLEQYLACQNEEFRQRSVSLTEALEILMTRSDSNVGIRFSQDANYITQLINDNCDHVEWLNTICENSIAGCVNAPRNGFMEIFAWVQIALQPTFEQKIKHAAYLYLIYEARNDVSQLFIDKKLGGAQRAYYPEITNYTIEKVVERINEARVSSNRLSWLGLYGDYTYLDGLWAVSQPTLEQTPQEFIDKGAVGQNLVQRLYEKTICVSFETLEKTCRNAHHVFQYLWSIDLIRELNSTRNLQKTFCQLAYEISSQPNEIQTIKDEAEQTMSPEDYASFEKFLTKNILQDDNQTIKESAEDFCDEFFKTIELNYAKALLLSAEDRFQMAHEDLLSKKIRW